MSIESAEKPYNAIPVFSNISPGRQDMKKEVKIRESKAEGYACAQRFLFLHSGESHMAEKKLSASAEETENGPAGMRKTDSLPSIMIMPVSDPETCDHDPDSTSSHARTTGYDRCVMIKLKERPGSLNRSASLPKQPDDKDCCFRNLTAEEIQMGWSRND